MFKYNSVNKFLYLTGISIFSDFSLEIRLYLNKMECERTKTIQLIFDFVLTVK